MGPAPLVKDDEGVLRVVGTRVTLDSIVAAFDLGATPEEIAGHLELARDLAQCFDPEALDQLQAASVGQGAEFGA